MEFFLSFWLSQSQQISQQLSVPKAIVPVRAAKPAGRVADDQLRADDRVKDGRAKADAADGRAKVVLVKVVLVKAVRDAVVSVDLACHRFRQLLTPTMMA